MQTGSLDAVHGDLLGIVPCEPRPAKRPAAIRTEQALLFGSDGGKQNRAARSLRSRSEGASQFEKNAASGSVVLRAIEDIVAGHIGTDAEVIVVCGVDYSFVGNATIGTGKNRKHIVGFEVADLADHVGLR